MPRRHIHGIYSRSGPKTKKQQVLNNLNGAHAVSIDEISACETELFGSADGILRSVLEVPDKPFGDLTTILSGDFNQKKP
mgnify:CR=1 FL=1